MSELLLSQEVGSLAKPDWRVAAVAGREITKEHVISAAAWSDRLGLDPIETEDIICHAREEQRSSGGIIVDNLQSIRNLAVRQAVALQEKAGLDIVYDGEQDRSEMYQHAVARTNGLTPRGTVRAFDNRSYKKFAVIGEPSIDEPWHTAEVERLRELTDRQIKVPITGPYTLADWSFDEYFGGDKRELVLSIATNVIRPNLQAILDTGIDWIQIDEPAAGTKAGETDIIVESFNQATADLVGRFSIHLCYSDWDRLFPEFEGLNNCNQFSIEFANRDPDELGRDSDSRPAYEVLRGIYAAAPNTGIGLGVVSIHENKLESPELIRDRVLRAVDIVDDPALVYPSPDCGLRTRSWDVAYEKLVRVAEGTNLAKQELGVN